MSRIPVSAPHAQQHVVWAFPGLIALGAYHLFDASAAGRVALLVCIMVVITGWSSYALLGENQYNDVLFFSDVGLVVGYLVAIRAASQLSATPAADGILWIASSSIFALYALWDLGAAVNTETAARASKFHLQTFSYISIALAAATGVWGAFTLSLVDSRLVASRWVLLAIWIGVLVSWHVGRVRAAVKDS